MTINAPLQSTTVPLVSIFGWIIIHQHLGDSFNWQLSWNNYTKGFGSIDADFWLGLDNMHYLTGSQDYRLRVEMERSWPNLWYSAEYWTFRVGPGFTKYRLEVSGYSGDAGDSLQYDVTSSHCG